MKQYLLLITFTSLCISSFTQQQKKQLNGVTFSYTCHSNDSVSKTIFVGQKELNYTLQINHKTVENKKLIDSNLLLNIESIVTFDFINRLINCCRKNNCPDTICYYYISLKKGKKSESVYIDLNFANIKLCGDDDFNKLIQMLNQIGK
jgi:hypothetical protein